MTNYQITNIKHFFPIFEKRPDLVYLDSAATALKPKAVIDKVTEYYGEFSANIHRGIYEISDRASEEYDKVRQIVKKYINAKDESEIIFSGGTTDSINIVARGWGEDNVKAGDEIVITEMEHHANLVPWQRLGQKVGAKLVYAKINDNFIINNDEWNGSINNKTKIVALTAMSNVLGTINNIEGIIKIIKSINPKTLVLVDGAQSIAHFSTDVQRWGIDFLAFSGHKIYGPTGVGVLWGRKEILSTMEPVRYGGGMIREVTWQQTDFRDTPERFEAGTPPIAQVIGMGVAIEWVEKIGIKNIEQEEKELTSYTLKKLNAVDGLKIFGPQKIEERGGVFSMSMAGVHPHDVAEILNRFGVCVRSGHHCAMPLHQKMGVEATFRASLGIYNNKDDIDKLLSGLAEVNKILLKNNG